MKNVEKALEKHFSLHDVGMMMDVITRYKIIEPEYFSKHGEGGFDDFISKAEYKQGYADGISDLRNKLMVQVHDVLECERESYANGGETDKNLQGWIECLEMFKQKLIGEEL